MSVPHWRRSIPRANHACDVCVIGAGITGIAAALALHRRGARTLVVERGSLASGASGRNAGFLMRGAADNYAAAVRDMGRDRARFLWKWTEDNLADLLKEGIETLPTFQRVPSCLLALTHEEADELRRSYELLVEDGFASELIDSGTDAAWKSGRAILGLVNPHDAACNPHHLMCHLAAKLPAGSLLEHREVMAIDADPSRKGSVTVRLADEAITCERALVCTNAYAPLILPALAPFVAPRRGQMLALRVDRRLLDASYYSNHGSEYFRQPAPDTVVVGGWRKHFEHIEVGYEDRTTPEVQHGLESFARTILGRDYEVTARWSGTMGFTPDGLPLIGPVLTDPSAAPGSGTSAPLAAPPDHPVWFCGGYTGHGMSMAFRTAHAAAGAMLSPGHCKPENPFPLSRFGL